MLATAECHSGRFVVPPAQNPAPPPAARLAETMRRDLETWPGMTVGGRRKLLIHYGAALAAISGLAADEILDGTRVTEKRFRDLIPTEA